MLWPEGMPGGRCGGTELLCRCVTYFVSNSLVKRVARSIATGRHRWCICRALCSSPVELVTFLARRLAALAGTSSAVNDGLRTAGALQLLAALCYSPLPEARHLAAKALAGAGWNATTSRSSSSSSGRVSGTAGQRRVLAAALRKEWDAWVAEICPVYDGQAILSCVDADGLAVFKAVDRLEAAAAVRARTFAATSKTTTTTLTSTTPTRSATAITTVTAATNAAANDSDADTAAASDESDRDSPSSESDAPLLRGLGPRARVRAQRQWALRRLRARARPNSANLAVLGQPAVLQALAELCAASSSSSDSSSSSSSVSSSSRSDSIAAYAARRDAAAALSVASHLPANAVRMATKPLLVSISTATTGTAAGAGAGASAASAGAATVAAALCTLCADAGAGGEARGHAAIALGNIAHSGGAAFRDTLGQLGAVEALLSIVKAAVASKTQ
eukprot:10922-Heterococcus_DN1.PRE.1